MFQNLTKAHAVESLAIRLNANDNVNIHFLNPILPLQPPQLTMSANSFANALGIDVPFLNHAVAMRRAVLGLALPPAVGVTYERLWMLLHHAPREYP
jgi:hypothetical protein